MRYGLKKKKLQKKRKKKKKERKRRRKRNEFGYVNVNEMLVDGCDRFSIFVFSMAIRQVGV